MSGPVPSSYHSTASAALTIDWLRLSPRSTAILRLVATPISEGYSPAEIARELGTSMNWVSNCLDDLRTRSST
jgi:DNA-binding CsgD family transcriptional regulator